MPRALCRSHFVRGAQAKERASSPSLNAWTLLRARSRRNGEDFYARFEITPIHQIPDIDFNSVVSRCCTVDRQQSGHGSEFGNMDSYRDSKFPTRWPHGHSAREWTGLSCWWRGRPKQTHRDRRTLQPVHRSVDRYRQSATPRIDHTATLLANGEVLVAGGVSSTYTATAELYNPLTGQWTATGSMTVPRAFAAAALWHNGQVLIAGGSNRDGTANVTAELYNPATGKWTATTNMPGTHGSPATLLPSGKVLVIGGGGVFYDPSTARWAATGPLYYGITGWERFAAGQWRRSGLRKQVLLLRGAIL